MQAVVVAMVLVHAHPGDCGSVRPSARQLSLQRNVRATQFVHFSVCTFAGCEQDTGPAPATVFAPTATVDPDQWVAVAKSWGAAQLCLTAHHSGGFALW
jgi:alpha-L-fucosidase